MPTNPHSIDTVQRYNGTIGKIKMIDSGLGSLMLNSQDGQILLYFKIF